MSQAMQKATRWLQQLIQTPSLSREEDGTAAIILSILHEEGLSAQRVNNNVVARGSAWDDTKPTLLLCSHHDTVKPNAGYTRDPFRAEEIDGRLYGLGSNDAGAALVSLMAAFAHLQTRTLPYNLLLAAVAEEEISGPHGVASLLDDMPAIHLAIVGEPTGMRMAIAEKGLMVVDGVAEGIPGHAAHGNTRNPIYEACVDIDRIRRYEFDRISPLLGKTKASVTQIQAGTQHNQVPAQCAFVIDVRVNEMYTNEEVFTLLQEICSTSLKARSFRLSSSGIGSDHPAVKLATVLGVETYGSATLSDQALIPYPSVKMGPGDSTRSHTADEFVYLDELQAGINGYIEFLEKYRPDA